MLPPGGRKWWSLYSGLLILALAAPGSSLGCPKAARRMPRGAPGALRGRFWGVPEHSEDHLEAI